MDNIATVHSTEPSIFSAEADSSDHLPLSSQSHPRIKICARHLSLGWADRDDASKIEESTLPRRLSILCDRVLANTPECRCSPAWSPPILSLCISETGFQIQFHSADGLFQGWAWNPDPSSRNGNLPLQGFISVTDISKWNINREGRKWMWHSDDCRRVGNASLSGTPYWLPLAASASCKIKILNIFC